MGRIRSIKPEFPQSESIGRLSRDARLLFVQLWTFADDSGRARGAFALLSSMLFPYDSDAPELIGDWLSELEREGCISLYEAEGSKYLQITNWLKHQKIEKPSASKIPPFPETSPKPPRNLPEASVTDLGPRIKERESERKNPAPNGATKIVKEKPDTALYRRGKEILGPIFGGKVVKAMLKHADGDLDDVDYKLKQIKASSNPNAYAAAILQNIEHPEAVDDWIT